MVHFNGFSTYSRLIGEEKIQNGLGMLSKVSEDEEWWQSHPKYRKGWDEEEQKKRKRRQIYED